MSLSMDGVYQTLNSLFMNQFNINAGDDDYRLRFGQSRSQITSQGYGTPAQATESFSGLVNQVPVDKGDGVTIFFSGATPIDEFYYYNLITPATVKNAGDAATFGNIKEEANRLWLNNKLESTSGVAQQFSPCLADPNNWYSITSDYWTHESLSLSDPATPAPNNTFTISFDYGKVTITRPWFFEPFINNQSWYIPHTYAGQLTSSDQSSNNLAYLPVGLITIKNLQIQGPLITQEIASFQSSFGPFLVTTANGDVLECADIQVVGWLLQKMPQLPPLPDDGLPGRTYSLIDKAALATWISYINNMNGAPPNGYNPSVWGQGPMSPGGSAAVDQNITLENERSYDALRTFSMSGPSGTIKGVFPAVGLTANSTFSAQVGFAINSPQNVSNSILFQVGVATNSNPVMPPKIIFSQMKNYTNSLIDIEVDLSAFAGQSVYICLMVQNAAPPSIGATAYWVNPVINIDGSSDDGDNNDTDNSDNSDSDDNSN